MIPIKNNYLDFFQYDVLNGLKFYPIDGWKPPVSVEKWIERRSVHESL